MRSGDDNALARLAGSRDEGGKPFLQPHHLAAASQLSGLIDRARLMPRVTMSYDPSRIGGGRNAANGVSETSDSAASARQRVSILAATLPLDCWGVIFDVCGLGKGLQAIETERRWPRRSAKLVLRIGLEQLASQFGLSPHVAGRQGETMRGWQSERLPLIAETVEEPGSAQRAGL